MATSVLMPRAAQLLLVALATSAALAGCGDDDPRGGPTADEALARLQALPGVTAVEEATETTGYRYFVVRFTQPVDHANPGGATFEQRVSLIHKNGDAPLIAFTTGYWDYYQDIPYELTELLQANQISIEHRYFGESRPEPADWSQLTIRAMADDEHAIISALREVYPGAVLTTGGSKGGMTATYHRRFYPDDVDGTVAYVAPLSFGAPDPRYDAFFDTVGTPACREAVRAAALAMLQTHRAGFEARAAAQALEDGHAYTRVAIGPAVEGSIASLEFAFWQYFGVATCPVVPAPTASEADLWDFLDRVAPVSDNADAAIERFEAYYYQAYQQLGFPGTGGAALRPLLIYEDADYDGALPTAVPAYDGGAAMRDIDSWVQTAGDRLMFVYGEWDPWTAGQYELGAATDSLKLIVPQGTHGAEIQRLAPADRDRAFAALAAWTGVQPGVPQAGRTGRARPQPREPRVPPAILRAARTHR